MMYPMIASTIRHSPIMKLIMNLTSCCAPLHHPISRAEFDDEEKRIANETQAAKPAAATANDPSGDDDDMEGSSFGGGDANDDGYENDEDDGDECRKNDETEEEQPEAYSTTDNDDDDEKDEQKGSKPKRVPTETTQQIPSQENDGDVSGLKDNVNGMARGGEVGAGNQDILYEMEELKAELKAKSQSEAKLKAELKAKCDELGVVQAENNQLRNQAEGRSAGHQDELRRLHHDNETKDSEINRLRRELEFLESANSKIADFRRTYRALRNDDE